MDSFCDFSFSSNFLAARAFSYSLLTKSEACLAASSSPVNGFEEMASGADSVFIVVTSSSSCSSFLASSLTSSFLSSTFESFDLGFFLASSSSSYCFFFAYSCNFCSSLINELILLANAKSLSTLANSFRILAASKPVHSAMIAACLSKSSVIASFSSSLKYSAYLLSLYF